MKILLFASIVLLSFAHASAQNWERSESKKMKVLGENVVRIPMDKAEAPFSIPENAQIDTSTTIVGDTAGVSLNGEYLDHRSFYTRTTKKAAKLNVLLNDFVTVGDYEEFMASVLDSTARHFIYLGMFDSYEARNFINYEDYYFDEEDLEYVEINFDQREKNRDIFYLNYDTKIDYQKSLELIPLISQFYLPMHERFYRKRAIDDRKLYYEYYTIRYKPQVSKKVNKDSDSIKKPVSGALRGHQDRQRFIIDHKVPVYVDDFKWAERTTHNFDEYAILSQLYRITDKDQPITGITSAQAQAYCVWKTGQLNKDFGNNPYFEMANVHLPTKEECSIKSITPSIQLDPWDYTSQWKISREEYEEFYNYVQDSTWRDYAYWTLDDHDDAARLLNSTRIYFDEGSLDYREFEPSHRTWNHDLFPLNFDSKLNIKRGDVAKKYAEFEEQYAQKRYNYRFYYVDVVQKSKIGEVDIDLSVPTLTPMYTAAPTICVDEVTGEEWECYGKDLELDVPNKEHHGAGVRAHRDISRFIVQEDVSIEPIGPITKENREKDITGSLRYIQALAFYSWKYPIQKAKEGDEWRHYVYPSEEEFKLIQSGQSIRSGEKSIDLPTPGFRYSVLFNY